MKTDLDLRNVFLMSVTFHQNESGPSLALRAKTIYRVTCGCAVIDRCAVVVLRHKDLNRCSGTVAERIADLECNRVNASIKVAITFAPQLD